MNNTDCVNNNSSLSDEEKWRELVGTEYNGNLPQHIKNNHIGNCWNPCPYDITIAPERAKIMLGLDQGDPLPVQVLHNDGEKHFFMRPDRRGVWGYECTYSGCPHLLNTGRSYFYR